MDKGMMFCRAAFNYDRDEASLASGLACDPAEGVTQQQFKEETDINTIVERFGLTGSVPENLRVPVSGDFTSVGDFHSAMNVVRAAQESFMELPGDLRFRFNNDPGRFLDFVYNEANRDEAIKLGLIQKPVEVPRDAVRAIDELAAKIVPKPSVV